MSICDYNTTFKGINSISQDLLLNILESNFKMFFDWAFLNIGSWFTIDGMIPSSSFAQSGIYGTNSHSNAYLTVDPSYDNGSIWQGIRKDWVWETGVMFNSGSPIEISGVYVNGSFLPIGSGYHIDYPLGRIVFDSPKNTSSNIKLNYSYRHVQVYRSGNNPWFNILQYSSYETDNKDIKRSSDGNWSIGGQHRIQMPCIVIESLARSRSRPHEIGNNNLIIEQDIAFHILAETKNERNKLLDILRLQQDLVIWLYDTNKLSQDDNFPLNYDGSLKNNPLMYPNIIEQYKWRKCWLKNINIFDVDSVHPNLYRGLVKITAEIISE